MISLDRDLSWRDRTSAVTQFPSVEGLSYGPKGLDHTYDDLVWRSVNSGDGFEAWYGSDLARHYR